MVDDRLRVIGGPDFDAYTYAVARSVYAMVHEPVLDAGRHPRARARHLRRRRRADSESDLARRHDARCRRGGDAALAAWTVGDDSARRPHGPVRAARRVRRGAARVPEGGPMKTSTLLLVAAVAVSLPSPSRARADDRAGAGDRLRLEPGRAAHVEVRAVGRCRRTRRWCWRCTPARSRRPITSRRAGTRSPTSTSSTSSTPSRRPRITRSPVSIGREAIPIRLPAQNDPANLTRGMGENQSMKQMVDKMKADHSIDAKRVFLTRAVGRRGADGADAGDLARRVRRRRDLRRNPLLLHDQQEPGDDLP